MGCDIHMVMQVKVDGQWVTKNAANDEDGIIAGEPRDYEFFARIANVRNRFEIVPVAEPRGFPDDFVLEERNDGEFFHQGKWMGDHSHSWLTLGDLRNDFSHCDLWNHAFIMLIWELADEAWQPEGPTVPEIRLGARDNDIRIVFGFDS